LFAELSLLAEMEFPTGTAPALLHGMRLRPQRNRKRW
jgi:hypothetical protein